MNVRGPVFLSYLKSDSHLPRIYTIGDNHSKQSVCETKKIKTLSLTQMLQEMSQTQPVDLFLESEDPKYRKMEDDEPSFLLDVEQFIDKKSNRHNLRIHYCDIREGNGFRENLLRKIDAVYWTCRELVTQPNKENRAAFEKALHEVFPLRLTNVMRALKLHRQLEFVQDTKIRRLIDAKFGTALRNSLPIAPKDTESPSAVMEFWKRLRLFTSALMDYYTMARLFRQFKDGTYPRFVVLYFGMTHIRTYLEFLEELGYKQEVAKSSMDLGRNFQCIPIDDFLPWWKD